ncbi:MAG: ATP F0F1 synthase subunit B [Zetaproteobacteria bacterium CG12_big_fil_rev_8_21_14_0_65_55_1124]|nr:MAG: ATP synthase F0 subunit B [Zetaproteobacteria bacterium CG1_02_55_237]PIS18849.1 MAG: ATP F0F1 synthase subunit B [Zetaproteobacteria bacterium CG08_land_8_20_14_0_20_55_17]PIW42766.1 MAG: ATP F0F1 synthase subunit B [Zetaproteobacteria bacterium CG12_big_fil_rev_8_21_14_0_65_55_1124]PIY51794.1 MAG: ATP F0F1 synthase subunit B [Zetaproteobacteria bacterium CG_4_10_14_0_8_um_filter_55_43]PIZ40046.1 MAG: ATP F0F1 synthase subunit B [Zetaproteobacteria bacterium CG_4_10_14_0_2_um_filter_55
MSIDLTFIGQIVVFLTLLVLLKKYLYGPLNSLMEQRSAKIAEGLAAADAGKEAKAKADVEIAGQLKEARKKAQEILAAAEKRAAEIQEEITNKARDEAGQIVQAAREEVDAEVNKARMVLRKEVAGIAIAAAERIINAELDGKRHSKLIDDVVAQGFGNA